MQLGELLGLRGPTHLGHPGARHLHARETLTDDAVEGQRFLDERLDDLVAAVELLEGRDRAVDVVRLDDDAGSRA